LSNVNTVFGCGAGCTMYDYLRYGGAYLAIMGLNMAHGFSLSKRNANETVALAKPNCSLEENVEDPVCQKKIGNLTIISAAAFLLGMVISYIILKLIIKCSQIDGKSPSLLSCCMKEEKKPEKGKEGDKGKDKAKEGDKGKDKASTSKGQNGGVKA